MSMPLKPDCIDVGVFDIYQVVQSGADDDVWLCKQRGELQWSLGQEPARALPESVPLSHRGRSCRVLAKQDRQAVVLQTGHMPHP